MLTNFDLEEVSKHYNFDLIVVMKDELINHKPKNGNYIINLQSTYEGNGTHWTMLSIRDKKCFYQDSFGIIPPKEFQTHIWLSARCRYKILIQKHVGFMLLVSLFI